MPPRSGRILVLHAGALGDCVLTLSIAEALKLKFPETRIEMLARSALAPWSAGRSAVDHAQPLEHAAWGWLFGAAAAVEEVEAASRRFPFWDRLFGAAATGEGIGLGPVAPISSGRPGFSRTDLDSLIAFLDPFDMIVSLLGDNDHVTSRVLARAAPGRCYFVDPGLTQVAISARIHIVEQWCRDLAGQGLALDSGCFPRLHVDDRLRRETKPRLIGSGRLPAGPLAVLHPGSGGRWKCWPAERFAACARLLTQMNFATAFMLGPAELEGMSSSEKRMFQRSAPVVAPESLAQAVSMAATADVYVGNDGGMTHAAAACGVPTAAVFGPTDPAIWAPRGPNVVVVDGCHGCGSPRGCRQSAAGGDYWNRHPQPNAEELARIIFSLAISCQDRLHVI